MRTLISTTLTLAGLMLAPAALAASHTLSIALHEQNQSGESGKAELIAKGEKTEVILHLEHSGMVPQPAHIHEGTCGNLNPKPAFVLKPVEHGKSVTLIDVSLEKLLAGKYAINVHKSAKHIQDFVACSDIAK